MQEIFNKVKAHLLAQGKRSEDDHNCLYRGPDGLKCAVGCLIEDSAYNPTIEGSAVVDITSSTNKESKLLRAALQDSGVELNHQTINLLAQLQQLHDKLPPAGWSAHLKTIADDFGLDYAN